MTEVYCGYCGAAVVGRKSGKFCSAACYHHKRRSQPAEQRFWSKVDRSGECWIWTASRWGSGYGQFGYLVDGVTRNVGAHVYAYELSNGPIPDGLEIMHACDNRLCVRPDHLGVGTHAQNVQDAAQKGRLRVSRPNRQKLSADDIHEIRSLVTAGELRVRVAERFGITKAYVTRIMAGTARPYDAPIERAS